MNPPKFQVRLDTSRPHVLEMEGDPRKAHQLTYRYTDDQTRVTVPNTWYNQTNSMRAEYYAFVAKGKVMLAAKYELGYTNMPKDASIDIARALRKSAAHDRARAERLMRAGAPHHTEMEH